MNDTSVTQEPENAPQAAMSDGQVINAMHLFGGSFVRSLSTTLSLADPENLARLKAAFPRLWNEYADLARLHAARQTASA